MPAVTIYDRGIQATYWIRRADPVAEAIDDERSWSTPTPRPLTTRHIANSTVDAAPGLARALPITIPMVA
jgi:hypothetical protein